MYRQIESNRRKTWLLMFLFVAVLAGIGLVLGWLTGTGSAFLCMGAGLAVMINVAAYFYSDKVTLSASGARHLGQRENEELRRLVENLCIASGLRMPRLCQIDDPAANAFATGRDPEHATLVVTRGLLEKLDRQELEGVVAHELSHIKNHDTRLQTIVVMLIGWLALLGDAVAGSVLGADPTGWVALEGRSFAGLAFGTAPANATGSTSSRRIVPPHPAVWAALLMALVGGQMARLIALAISRKREFVADAEAALLTRYPEALARALEKMYYDTDVLKRASRATAHIYVVNPLPWGWQVGLLARLSATHPPMRDRIAALRGMGA